jgi:hypothetical protein
MLGLRPRLTSRPSLLDLIHKKNIDQISASVEKVVPVLEAAVKPFAVPLPASPLIAPHREELPPPRITLQEDSDDDAKSEELVEMPPVSSVTCAGQWERVANGGDRRQRRSRRRRRRRKRSMVSLTPAMRH